MKHVLAIGEIGKLPRQLVAQAFPARQAAALTADRPARREITCTEK